MRQPYAPYAKAITAFLVGGLSVAFTALADGAVSPQEWVGIALGALGTPASVYAITNRGEPNPAAHTERGAA